MAEDKSENQSTTSAGPGGRRGGPGGYQGVVEKPKNFWGTTARLMHYMSDRIVGLILVLIFAITSVIFQIRTPKILGQATTEIYKGVMKGTAEQKAGWLGSCQRDSQIIKNSMNIFERRDFDILSESCRLVLLVAVRSYTS